MPGTISVPLLPGTTTVRAVAVCAAVVCTAVARASVVCKNVIDAEDAGDVDGVEGSGDG